MAAGIFATTVGVFAASVRCDFIIIDDPVYVVTNPLVRQGLSWHGMWEALLATVADLWLPVTLVSHMVDVSIWGFLLHGFNAAGMSRNLLNG